MFIWLLKGPHLIECDISVGDDESWHLPPVPPRQRITAHKLQSLAVKGDCLEFLSHFDLPSLTSFRLNSGQTSQFDMSRLIGKSSCNLKTLHLCTRANFDDTFMHCMRLLPSLTELKLLTYGGATLPLHFIEALGYDETRRILLPNVEVLSYHGMTDFQLESLVSMLRQRCRRPLPPWSGSSYESPVPLLSNVTIYATKTIPV